MGKLLEGDRDTLRLFLSNPFPDHPPTFVRAKLYRYQFTSPEERRERGQWWKRQFVAEYFPEVSLRHHGLRRAFQEEGWH
jgi:hypothetical protein